MKKDVFSIVTSLRRGLLLGMVLVIASCTTVENKKDTVHEAGDKDSVITSEVTPLSAIYELEKVYDTPIKIHVKGKTEDMDIIHCAVFDTVEIPIHGLYQNYTNSVTITVDEGDYYKEIAIEIEVGYLSVPNATIKTDLLGTADPYNQDFYFVSRIHTPFNFIAYDRKGYPRYAVDIIQHHTVFYTNGQILIRNNNGVHDLFYKNLVSYSAHHDSIQIDNGNYVVLVESTWGVCDRVLELNNTGSINKDKTFGSLFRDVVSSDDMSILNQIIYDDENIFIGTDNVQLRVDWAHANSVVYDENTDIMYFSLRHQGVIAVDYSEWKLIWWMADNDLYTKMLVADGAVNFTDVPSLQDYRVMGAGKIDGPKNQHALFLLENGNLGMFDNAGDEDSNPEGSRYVEYEIGGALGSWTATKEREYRDSSLYSRITSDVDFTGEGNLLMTWGVPYRVREIDTDFSTVLFDLQIVNASGQMYRADKMPLYPYMDKNKAYAEDNNLKN